MKRSAGLYLYIILLILFSNDIFGQNIKGVVVDIFNNPLAETTIYIDEIRQGLLSNHEGKFQLQLNNGEYTLISKRIGYKTEKTTIFISQDSTTLDIKIVLLENELHNPYGSREKEGDALASEIIKNTISKASLHANSTQYYHAYSYTNGNLKIKSIPDLIDKIGYKIYKSHILTLQNESFAQEIYNKIEYSNPSNFKITEEATSGNIPKGINNKGVFDFLDGSIYLNRFNEFISPIGQSAFSYYRYKYLGYYKDDDQIFHKIKIETKLKDPELLEGNLYIADSTWHIGYAEIASRKSVKQKFTIFFQNFGENTYLPISYLTELELNELGLSADAIYYTSLKYNTIISNKDVNEILDIPSITDNTEKTIPHIEERDTVFWNKKRTMPVTNMDSLNKYLTDSLHAIREKYHPTNFWLGKIILGDYILGNDTSEWSVKYNGTKMIFRDYNYVDGFWLGDRFEITNRLEDDKSLMINPYIYYATARNRLLGGGDIIYNYAPKREGFLTVATGSRSEDFNSLTVTRYQNYFSSLVLGENYNSFYQRDFITANNEIYLSNKFKISSSFGVERRRGLSNNTDFNIFNRNNIKPNIFPDDRFDRTFYAAGISYSPFANYLISNAFDVHQKEVTPVFHIEYEEGFSSWQTNNSKYRKLKGGIIHNIHLDYFNKIDYKIEGGVFLKRGDNMHFTDYQHFGSSDLLINLNSLFDSFLLLDNYELQTNRYWVNVFFNYSGKYVLLKYIPFLQGKPFTENIHIKTLFTPDIDSYVELGYSLSITRNMGIGSFISFKNMEGKKFGVRFSFNLSSLGL